MKVVIISTKEKLKLFLIRDSFKIPGNKNTFLSFMTSVWF